MGLYINIALFCNFERAYEFGEEELIIKIVSNKETGNYYDKYIGRVKGKKLKILIYVKSDEELEYGDIIYCKGELKKPNTARNEGGFDYAEYLKQKRIIGIYTIDSYEKVGTEKSILYYVSRVRKAALNRIENLYSAEESGFLKAILIGQTSELDSNIKENFRLSNLSHVLAISGMHISYIVLALDGTLRYCIKDIKKRELIIIVFLIFWVPFVGASASVMRACIMTIIAYIAKLLLRKDDFYTSLIIAFVVILLINPYNIYSVSMWLSFGGSLGIVLFSKFIKNVINHKIRKNKTKTIIAKIVEIASVSLSAQIVIAPIMLYYFNTISLSFIISNILVSWVIRTNFNTRICKYFTNSNRKFNCNT